MKAEGIGLSLYRQLVTEIRQRKGHLLQVFNWTDKIKENHLVLEGDWLVRQGFRVGDPILLRLEPGLIRIKHVPIQSMDFSKSPCDHYQLAKVGFEKQAPLIYFNAVWLQDYGFLIGTAASLTDESGVLILKPCQQPKTRTCPHTMPKQVNIRIRNKIPYLQLAGTWLSDIGYTPGDPLVIQCRENQLVIRRLEEHHLHF